MAIKAGQLKERADYQAYILEMLRDPNQVKPVNPDNDAVLPDEEA